MRGASPRLPAPTMQLFADLAPQLPQLRSHSNDDGWGQPPSAAAVATATRELRPAEALAACAWAQPALAGASHAHARRLGGAHAAALPHATASTMRAVTLSRDDAIIRERSIASAEGGSGRDGVRLELKLARSRAAGSASTSASGSSISASSGRSESSKGASSSTSESSSEGGSVWTCSTAAGSSDSGGRSGSGISDESLGKDDRAIDAEDAAKRRPRTAVVARLAPAAVPVAKATASPAAGREERARRADDTPEPVAGRAAAHTAGADVVQSPLSEQHVQLLLPSTAALARHSTVLVELPPCFDASGDTGAIGRVLVADDGPACTLDLKGVFYTTDALQMAGTAAVVRINAAGGGPRSAMVERLFGTYLCATRKISEDDSEQQPQQMPSTCDSLGAAAGDDAAACDRAGRLRPAKAGARRGRGRGGAKPSASRSKVARPGHGRGGAWAGGAGARASKAAHA